MLHFFPNHGSDQAAVAPQFFQRLSLLVATLGLTSCAGFQQANLKKTEVFYRASTMDVYLPKPPETTIPVLNKMPPRSKVIGQFAFTTPKGSRFAIDAATYNARRVGADAVVIRKLDEQSHPYSYYVPPQTTSVPHTRPINVPFWVPEQNGVPGHWQNQRRFETFYITETTPGHVVSGTNHHTTIDAVMIRQK